MSRTILIALASTQTGLTLSAQLYTSAGAASGSAITSGFTELGHGFYQWTYTLPSDFQGTATFSASGVIVAANALNPAEFDYVNEPISQVYQDVWGAAIPASYAAGTAGQLLGSYFQPLTASAVSSSGFTLGTMDPFFNLDIDFAGWVVIPTGSGGGQPSVVASSAGNVLTLTEPWPGGEPSNGFSYQMSPPIPQIPADFTESLFAAPGVFAAAALANFPPATVWGSAGYEGLSAIRFSWLLRG